MVFGCIATLEGASTITARSCPWPTAAFSKARLGAQPEKYTTGQKGSQKGFKGLLRFLLTHLSLGNPLQWPGTLVVRPLFFFSTLARDV